MPVDFWGNTTIGDYKGIDYTDQYYGPNSTYQRNLRAAEEAAKARREKAKAARAREEELRRRAACVAPPFIDNGENVTLVRQDDASVLTLLRYSVQKFGKPHINGDNRFRYRATMIARANNIELDNPMTDTEITQYQEEIRQYQAKLAYQARQDRIAFFSTFLFISGIGLLVWLFAKFF